MEQPTDYPKTPGPKFGPPPWLPIGLVIAMTIVGATALWAILREAP